MRQLLGFFFVGTFVITRWREGAPAETGVALAMWSLVLPGLVLMLPRPAPVDGKRPILRSLYRVYLAARGTTAVPLLVPAFVLLRFVLFPDAPLQGFAIAAMLAGGCISLAGGAWIASTSVRAWG